MSSEPVKEEPRTYVTMAGKSIGQCSSGHWLPLRGDCDLCGAGSHEKCRFSAPITSLKWKTRKENVADKIEMGTTNDGARNGMAKLTAEQALAIKHSAEADVILAERYGVLKATIGNIKNGRSWKCLNPEA